jgi:hypothetical protein
MTWKLKLLILTKGLHHSQITHMMHCMILKPQDVFITLKLVALGQRPWSYIMLANELFMSASEINAGVKRATKARLLAATSSRFQAPQPIVVALEEFLIHGVKYAFPPDRGELTRGVPTSSAGPPLATIADHSDELPPVWPNPGGPARGSAFSPLYRSVPQAAMADPKLYELLALLDAVRDERSRQRNLAARELSRQLQALCTV